MLAILRMAMARNMTAAERHGGAGAGVFLHMIVGMVLMMDMMTV